MFILTCGDALAVCRRPRQGLLAGLWELPNVPGRLASQQALQELERLGAAPRELLKMTEKTHVFTHITWQLRGFYVNCSERSGAFTWVSRAQYDRTVALPTAFRQFLDQEP